jgi:hypothetical protein
MNKQGHITSEEMIKWIIYIAILIAVSFAIISIVKRFV